MEDSIMLIGQKIVVVGGTSGIGLAVARNAADCGAEVYIGSSSADTGELWKDLVDDEREAKLQAKATSDLLTARAGIPDDAAKSYLYAIYNPYVTGQTIVVDGGGSLT
jgi:NAD(P)-dependent dehydrogenase (short-subunit alcohol dehydrogenase family)